MTGKSRRIHQAMRDAAAQALDEYSAQAPGVTPIITAEWVSLPVAEHAALMAVVEAARPLTNAVIQWRAVATEAMTVWEEPVVEAADRALAAILALRDLDGGAGEAGDDAS